MGASGRMILFVASLLLCTGLAIGVKLDGVSFSGMFSSDTPNNMCLTPTGVRANLRVAEALSDRIRLYSIGTCPFNTRLVLDHAREHGKKVALGLWIEPATLASGEEFFWLGQFAGEYQDVVDAVIVGNEAVSLHEVALEDLLWAIDRAKKILKGLGVNLPVTTAEMWQLLLGEDGPAFAEASDFICMQMHPYWEGRPVRCQGNAVGCTNAADYVIEKAALLEATYGKEVWICETGWPTAGEKCCQENSRPFAIGGFQAVPNIQNANFFLHDFAAAAKAAGKKYYYHTVMDSEWKKLWAPCEDCVGVGTDVPVGCGISDKCEMDYHWGILNSDGSSKPGLELPAI